MEHAGTDPDAFDAFEAAGWEQKAEEYDRSFGSLTSRLVEPLLDAAAVGSGARVLDVASGPGYAAGQAAARGAVVVGVDIAEAMVTLARRLHPGIDFQQADAQQLPFEDGSFEAVVGNLAILHLSRPEQAVAEFARVLATGGRLALTAWDRPDRARFVGVLFDAFVEAEAKPPSDIPAGPDFFRFADDEEFEGLLRDSGLEERRVETISFPVGIVSADELWNGLLGGTVRASALIHGQPQEKQERIREVFDRLVHEHRTDAGIELQASFKLASGRKSG